MFGPDTAYQHRLALTNMIVKGSNMANHTVCKIEACSNPMRSKGWCNTHYRRWKRNGDPEKTMVTIGGGSGTCSACGCDKPAKTIGHCKSHARRMSLYGSPFGVPANRVNGGLAQWIDENKSHKGDSCLIWPFGRRSNGYGSITYHGLKTTASRAMCMAAHGNPPTEKHEAAHSCGKGHECCVNPKHLRWATSSENQMDRVGHGTSNTGERHGMAKLTDDLVRYIRINSGVISYSALAREIGVCRQNVRSASLGMTWAHVKDSDP